MNSLFQIILKKLEFIIIKERKKAFICFQKKQNIINFWGKKKRKREYNYKK